VIDESRIEPIVPDGSSQLKGPSDAEEALRRGSTDHICGLQVDEQIEVHTPRPLLVPGFCGVC
jgi:hypothetical protein